MGWNPLQLFLRQTIFPQPLSVLYTSYNLNNTKRQCWWWHENDLLLLTCYSMQHPQLIVRKKLNFILYSYKYGNSRTVIWFWLYWNTIKSLLNTIRATQGMLLLTMFQTAYEIGWENTVYIVRKWLLLILTTINLDKNFKWNNVLQCWLNTQRHITSYPYLPIWHT